MKQRYINHTDPTSLLTAELENIPSNLKEQYSKLTEYEKKMVFCKMNGYNRLPPTIEQFYSDDYFLGGNDFFNGGNSIYSFWKTSLSEIYPNELLTSKNFLIESGAIGIGKSLISRISMAYNYARMLCMENPSKTFHLAPKPFSFVIYHRDEKVAYSEFKKWFKDDALDKCPFFINVKPNFKFQVLTSGPMSQVGLGSDVVVYILSEVNFYPNPQKAQDIVATAYGRMTSRFNSKAFSKIGNLIIDSSAKGDSSCTEWALDNMPPERTWYCHPAHYEVKPQDYVDSKGQTFPIYVGDGKYPNQVLPIDYRLAEDQDPDRVINVPIQLKIEAKQNLEKLLQDKCGIATSASDSFFGGSVEKLANCMKDYKNVIPEVVYVDFYDKTDRLIDKIKPAIEFLKPGQSLWLGLDLATTSDYSGISCCIFDEWAISGDSKFPKVKCIFSLAVSRKEGQETSLHHVFDLIMALKRRGFNVIVSADQAYSKQILQDCERELITTNGRISTDNVPCEPALYLKSLIMQGYIKIPENKRLLREAYDLRYVPMKKGLKIDHPKKATQREDIFDKNNGIGSKDVWDSLASAVYSLKMSIDIGEEDGYSSGIDKQLDLVKHMTTSSITESGERIQKMLEDIF